MVTCAPVKGHVKTLKTKAEILEAIGKEAPTAILFSSTKFTEHNTVEQVFHKAAVARHKLIYFKKLDLCTFPQALRILGVSYPDSMTVLYYRKGFEAKDLGGSFKLKEDCDGEWLLETLKAEAETAFTKPKFISKIARAL